MRSERATTVVSDLTGDDTHPADAAARAEQQVVEVAAAAGVRVLALDDPGFHHAAATVLQQIWSYQAGVPLPPEMLRAFVFTGNYVGAVFDGSQLVGVASAFRTDHGGLHSHIAGVLPSHQGRSIGYLLKLHQRAWALRRGIWSIAWTFDPLIRRNAHFNLIKLGASATRYLPDFYGAMTDGINAGDHSDRLLVEWELTGQVPGRPVETGEQAVTVLRPDAAGEPLPGPASGPERIIEVPADIELVRRTDPGRAARWRMALREALDAAHRDNHAIAGLAADGGYVTREVLPDVPPERKRS